MDRRIERASRIVERIRSMYDDLEMNGRLSISRDSKDVIRIRVRDNVSRREFVELSLTPEQFAMVMTGLTETPCKMEVKNLDKVGLKKESFSEVVHVPDGVEGLGNYCHEALENYLLNTYNTEEGWSMKFDSSNRQNVRYVEGGRECVITYERWVE